MSDESKQAEAFAKYHREHATYRGPSQEFHERAATFLVDVAQKLAAERTRREEAETRLSVALGRIREEFASRGAPTPGDGFAGILAGLNDLADRAERAEADNAALLEAGRAIDARRHELLDALYFTANDMPYGRHRDAVIDTWAKPGPGPMPEGPHPGAALLEEMRAIRSDLAKLEESACGTCAPDQYATPEARKVSAALERMRALEAFVQGFANMAENAIAHHTKPRTGMQVPYHDDFANLPPSGVAALERWWKSADAALKPETK